jgi:hypothetical protein
MEAQSNTKEEVKPATRVRETFVCSLCNLTEKYDYFGRKPPFCKAVVFVDDSYVMRDPFSSSRDNNANFLLLGSNCAVCSKPVCQECSLFFTRRICSICSKEKINLLPEELRKRINKPK